MCTRYYSTQWFNKVLLDFNLLSNRLTNYCLSRLQELVQNGIIPIVVFDGADLPIKQNTNDKRRLYLFFCCVHE